MSFKLSLILISFAVVWLLVIAFLVKREKISAKYSLIWICASVFVFLVGVCPWLISWLCDMLGIVTVSNFLIGIVITLLLIITLLLTIIITYQKKQIINLIQEVSILKNKMDKK